MIHKPSLVARHLLPLLILAVTGTAGQPATAGNQEAGAGALDGDWTFLYSRVGATGAYRQRCEAGDRDEFLISIRRSGRNTCGTYELTEQLGNHVDDGDLNDWRFTKTGRSRFQIHFAVSGASGDAIATVRGNRLIWKVTRQQVEPGENWPFTSPSSAVLLRQKPAEDGAQDPCS